VVKKTGREREEENIWGKAGENGGRWGQEEEFKIISQSKNCSFFPSPVQTRELRG